MDELKNLVIQTLETNGILGQLRAQLRSCVFKVIDNQEQVEKGQSSFHWENPSAKKVLHSAEGVVCAELIKEFLEFYRLDYTLQIYMPEVNLNQQQAMNKEELTRRAGLAGQATENKPLLMQILEAFVSGGGAKAPAPAPAAQNQAPQREQQQQQVAPIAPIVQEQPKYAPLSQQQNPRRAVDDDFGDDHHNFGSNKRGSPDLLSAGGGRPGVSNKFGSQNNQSLNASNKAASDHEKRLEIASQMLEEQSQEERSGYKAEIHKSADKSAASHSEQAHSPSPVAPPSRQPEGGAGIQKQKSNDLADNYGDDFEEIEEDIPEGGHDDTDMLGGSGNNFGGHHGGNQQQNQQHRSTIISQSAEGITVSQSLGVDPSVDSLALEDYDHIEPVERVNY